jgi:hypothetical protein
VAKTVFVAHEISGDIAGNIKKVIAICRVLHLKGIIPIFPSFIWRQYFTGITPEEKVLIGKVNEEYFGREMIDEVWIYGPRLSDGIKEEIRLAVKNGVTVIAKSVQLKEKLKEYAMSFSMT